MAGKVKPIRQPNVRVPGGKDYMLDTVSDPETHFYAYAEGDWGWVRMPTAELGPPGNVTLWGGRAEIVALLDALKTAVLSAPAI